VGWLGGFLLLLESLRGWDFVDLSERWIVVWVSLTGRFGHKDLVPRALEVTPSSPFSVLYLLLKDVCVATPTFFIFWLAFDLGCHPFWPSPLLPISQANSCHHEPK
jgi:hypothetical protein